MGIKFKDVSNTEVVGESPAVKKEYDGPPTRFWVNPKETEGYYSLTITLELAKQIVEANKDIEFYGKITPKGSIPMKVSKPYQRKAEKALCSIVHELTS